MAISLDDGRFCAGHSGPQAPYFLPETLLFGGEIEEVREDCIGGDIGLQALIQSWNGSGRRASINFESRASTGVN